MHPRDGAYHLRREPSGAPAVDEWIREHRLGHYRIPGQARELALTPLGGAYNRVSADATAFVHRSDEFLLEYTVTSDSAQPAASPRAATEWLGKIRELLNGYGTGRAYQNFADPELTDPLRAYYGQNL